MRCYPCSVKKRVYLKTSGVWVLFSFGNAFQMELQVEPDQILHSYLPIRPVSAACGRQVRVVNREFKTLAPAPMFKPGLVRTAGVYPHLELATAKPAGVSPRLGKRRKQLVELVLHLLQSSVRDHGSERERCLATGQRESNEIGFRAGGV